MYARIKQLIVFNSVVLYNKYISRVLVFDKILLLSTKHKNLGSTKKNIKSASKVLVYSHLVAIKWDLFL